MSPSRAFAQTGEKCPLESGTILGGGGGQLGGRLGEKGTGCLSGLAKGLVRVRDCTAVSHSERKSVSKVRGKSSRAPEQAGPASGGNRPSFFTSGFRELFKQKEYREIGSFILTCVCGSASRAHVWESLSPGCALWLCLLLAG